MDTDYKLQKLEMLVEKGYFDMDKNLVGVKFNFLRGIAKAKDEYEITKKEKLELFEDYLWIKKYEGWTLGSIKELIYDGFKAKTLYDEKQLNNKV